MKKFGFTLAEVIVTLGIIGIVAAITIPALISGSQDQANAAKLSSSVNTIENAFANAMTKERIANLNSSALWTNLDDIDNTISDDNLKLLAGRLSQYFALTGYKTSDGTTKYGLTSSGGKGDAINSSLHIVTVM